MTRRGAVAVVVLALWAGGLAALARREWMRPDGEKLAMAGLLVEPGATYFQVERDGQVVGYATSSIDTTTSAILVRDRLVTAAGGDGARLTAEATVELSRALAPRRFELEVNGGPIPLRVEGVPEGDSAIVLTVASGDDAATPQRVGTRGPALPPTIVPLYVALGEQRRVGGRMAVTLFDPSTMGPRDVVLRVVAESLFVVSDSAEVDGASGRWTSAHRDTVRAWRVVPEGSAPQLTGWVDAQGRLVEASYPGGYLLRRTSYEEAAINWERETREAASGG
ncbi:MAG TPA: hypothetical protein VGE02_10085 [Gemmatimonadales bacterium]